MRPPDMRHSSMARSTAQSECCELSTGTNTSRYKASPSLGGRTPNRTEPHGDGPWTSERGPRRPKNRAQLVSPGGGCQETKMKAEATMRRIATVQEPPP